MILQTTNLPGDPAMTEPTPKIKIRLLLADDHPVVRAGVRSCLSTNEHVEIVGEAADGQEAVSKARELHPDIVFMDTYMPLMNGLQATKVLNREVPAIKVLIHAAQNTPESVLEIVRSGARGYVMKNAPPEEMGRAIESVNRGDTYYTTEAAHKALESIAPPQRRRGRRAAPDLSDREVEVLRGIADGKSNREIAASLGIGVRTVETHRERIMQKLNVHNMAGLIRFAIAHGVASLE
jgi:two-component system nitrate/nitrite response regulator NarL